MSDMLIIWTRIAVALERIAVVGERILTDVHQIDASATAEGMQKSDLERFDDLTPEQEEMMAVIEMMEAEGRVVPAEVYKRLGLDPPRREDEPTEDELEADQPTPEDESDIVDARKEL